MARENLAEVLEEIAQLLELKAKNPFKIRAYRQSAETVRNCDGDIAELADKNELTGIKGIGDALRDNLHALASTGKLEFYEKLRAEFPPGLLELFDVQGLGPKKVKALYESLAIASVADLKAACNANKVAGLPCFGAKTQTKILEAIALRESFADSFLLGGITLLVRPNGCFKNLPQKANSQQRGAPAADERSPVRMFPSHWTFTSMAFGLSSLVFGTQSVSMPSLYSAVMLSALEFSGRVKHRSNEP